MPVVKKLFCFRIEPIEAALCADPDGTGAVFDNRPDDIIAQAVRVIGIVLVTRELPAVTSQFVEPFHGTHPDRPGPVFINRPNNIVAQAEGIVRFVPIAVLSAAAHRMSSMYWQTPAKTPLPVVIKVTMQRTWN